ncbi:MAG TPA: RluA family pseudouridine synthase [Salinivirgaceae bacterium]|nr:RluA family pseudouridine synthase [Salinivirgaceae bacterium]
MTQDDLQENFQGEFQDDNLEMFEHFRIVVDSGQGIMRIDKFLNDRITNASRTKIQAASEAGNILVNDQSVRSNYRVKPGDIIQVMMTYPPREIEIIPEDIPLNIVFEDDHLIVVNKPAGMVVHPSYGHYQGTLVNALAYYLKDNEMFKGNDPRPGLVHRIDKDTSGLLMIAKTVQAKVNLSKQFEERTTRRTYNALVWGTFPEMHGTVIGNIGRNPRNRKVMYVYEDENIGKHAVTHYSVLEDYGYVTLVECRLETGRTHQIRVHMQYIKHPIFNDPEYGGDKILKGTTFSKYKQFVQNCFDICPRQALHAKTLGFEHPVTGKSMDFDSELPDDFQLLVEKWRGYVENRDIEN